MDMTVKVLLTPLVSHPLRGSVCFILNKVYDSVSVLCWQLMNSLRLRQYFSLVALSTCRTNTDSCCWQKLRYAGSLYLFFHPPSSYL